MKLQDIYPPSGTTTQIGLHVEPNALMSLQNLVANGGKRRNTFELVILARFLQLIKDGNFNKEANPLFTASISTSPELMNTLRSMSDDQLAATASSVLHMIQYQGNCVQACAGPTDDYATWFMKFSHAREATD